MDWNKRNIHLSFYNSYLEYLSKTENKLIDIQQLKVPLVLSFFEKSAAVSILKKTLSEISTINCRFTAKNSIVELPKSKPSMKIRFEQHNLDKLYDEQTLQPVRDCFKAISSNKLETDIEIIRRALHICQSELEQSGKFSKFADFILGENREAYDEYSLIKMYTENMTKIKQLQSGFKKSHQSYEEMVTQLDNELFQLKNECDNYRKQNKMEIEMVSVWEKTRQEQIEAIFQHEVTSLTKARDECEDHTERELIAINEIMTFYHMKCNKLEESIRTWQRRYEADHNQFDEQIKNTRETIEDVKSKYELIQSWYEKREKFIDNYYSEQKELGERRKLEEKQRLSAIIIQAWWRGTMVRRQLGPYRPKKDKSKKSKGGKKK